MPGMQEITVGLRFTADTQQAKAQLASLKNDLNNLATMKNLDFNSSVTKSLSDASNAAAQLKVQLQEATNVKTGNLDLSKFNYSLKQSGMSLEKYKQQLFQLGSEGQQAFFQLTQSIQTAEIPLIRVNKLFAGLWDNLKRTAGWQISSTAIHAFMGAIQGAYHYAQDLNESLNNIRIVTGKSIDDMSKFAEQANKAAKALSTTTTAYTDAALIFYQQGLDGQDVEDRTNVVIKMANVTGQSAQTVSDQMTAVWNNFYDGSASLESFADKLTALGAATASSTDEITGGLEKFAAVAETVGLSFDYAASALATITAVTRQSEDTVGTALKTIFARLEGLSLGESLEDGTDLNKYSQALLSVGVNIKDANGGLKDMDNILDELGAKWQSLTRDQQMALAQTVAGTRQYNQLMSLMANWDYFQENLAVSRNAEGTLQDQADIYAESWDAAQKRVKAATESIYNDLLNDEFFIDLTDKFANILNVIDKVIDSLGGLKGLLPLILSLVLQISGDKVAAGLERGANSLRILMTGAKAEMAMKTEAASLSTGYLQDMNSSADQARAVSYENISKAQAIITANAKNMTEADLAQNEILLDQLKNLQKINIEKGKEVDIALENQKQEQKNLDLLILRLKKQRETDSKKDLSQERKDEIRSEIESQFGKNSKASADDVIAEAKRIGAISEDAVISHRTEQLDALREKIIEVRIETERLQNHPPADFTELDTEVNNFKKQAESVGELEVAYEKYLAIKAQADSADGKNAELNREAVLALEELKNAYMEYGASLNLTEEEQQEFAAEVNNLTEEQLKEQTSVAKMPTLYIKYGEALNKVISILVKQGAKEEEIVEILKSYGLSVTEAKKRLEEFNKTGENAEQGVNNFEKKLKQSKNATKTWSQSFVDASKTISQVVMAVNSLSSAAKTLTDPNISSWDKFTTILSSLTFAIPGLIDAFSDIKPAIQKIKNVKDIFNQTSKELSNQTGLFNKLTTALWTYIKGEDALALAKSLNLDLTEQENKKNATNILAKALMTAGYVDETGALDLNSIAKAFNIELTQKDTVVTAANKIIHKLLNHEISIGTILNKLFAGSILAIVEAAGMAAIVIGIVAATVWLLVKAFNADAEAAQAAAEETKRSAEAAQDSANKYTELKNNIEQLKNKTKILKDLTEGTLEWKQAILEINNEVLKLLQLYPELAKYITNENGILSISTEGYDKALEIQLKAAEEASKQSQAANIAEIKIKNSGLQSDMNQLLKEFNNNNLNTLGTKSLFKVSTLSPFSDELNNTNKNVDQILNEYIKNGPFTSLDRLAPWLSSKVDKLDDEQTGLLVKSINELCQQLDINSDSNIEQTKTAYALASNFSEFGVTISSRQNLMTSLAARKDVQGERTSNYISGKGNEEGVVSHKQILNDYLDMLNNARDGYKYTAKEEGWGKFVLVKTDIATGEEKSTNKVDYDIALEKVKAYYDSALNKVDYDNLIEFEKAMDSIKWDPSKPLEYRDALIKQAEALGYTVTEAEAYIETLSKEQQARMAAAKTTESVVDSIIEQKKNQGWTNPDAAKDVFRQQVQDFQDTLDTEDLVIFAKFELDPNSKEDFKQQFEKYKEDLEDQEIEVKVKEAAVEYDFDADEMKELGEAFDDTNEELAKQEGMLKANAEAASDAAIRYKRLNEAVQDLYDNYDKYEEVLKDLKKAQSDLDIISISNTKTAKELRKTIAGLLNTSEDLIDGKFLKGLDLKDVEQAAMGNINGLRNAFIRAQGEMHNLSEEAEDFINTIDSLEEGQIIDLNTDPFLSALIGAKIAAGATATDIENLLSGFLIDANIEPIYEDLEAVKAEALAAGDTIVESLSFDAEGEQQTIKGQDTMTTGWQENYTNVGDQSFEAGILTNADTGIQPVTITVPQLKKTVTWDEPEEVEKPILAVRIKNAHKSAGGKVSSNNKTTTSPKSGSSGGGGGGSSGSSKKTKKTSDEQDRYHELNKTLDTIAKRLDNVSAAKDRAFGQARINAIKAEAKELEAYADVLDQKYEAVLENLRQDKANAASLGAVFDENGNISNYNDVIAALVEEYNADESEDADEIYDEKKKFLEQYEETLELYQDLAQEKLEKQWELVDKKVEEADYVLELGIKLNEQDLKLIEFQIARLEDKEFGQAEQLLLYGHQANLDRESFLKYQNHITDVLRVAGATDAQIAAFLAGDASAITNLSDLTADMVDKMIEDLDNMIEAYNNYEEAYESTGELLVNLQEKYSHQFERLNDTMEFRIAELDHYKNLVDIIGADFLDLSSEIMQQMRRTSIEAIEKRQQMLANQLATEESNLEYAKRMQEKARKEGNDRDLAYWTELVENGEDAVRDITENIWSAQEDWVKAIKENWEATVDEMIKDIEKVTTGIYKSVDALSEAFDRQQTLAEQMLPDYQKAYELNKLNRDITKKIDESSSIRTQQKLRDFQKEINDLQKSGEQISQHDLDLLQKRYDLRVAEIALEEAQNAKSQVRLTRDASGNYGYVYTANENQVSEAQQKYDDAVNAVVKLQDDYAKEMSNQLIQTYKEMSQALSAAAKAGASREQLQELQNFYISRMTFFNGEFDKILANNAALTGEIVSTFGTATNSITEYMSGLATNFQDTILGQVLGDGYDDLDSWVTQVLELVGNVNDGTGLMGSIVQGNEDLNQVIAEKIGDIKTILVGRDGNSGVLKEISSGIDDVVDESRTLGIEATSGFNKLADAVTEAWKTMSPVLKQMADGVEGLLKTVNEAANAMATIANTDLTNANYNVDINGTQAQQVVGSGDSGDSGDDGGGGNIPAGTTPTVTNPTTPTTSTDEPVNFSPIDLSGFKKASDGNYYKKYDSTYHEKLTGANYTTLQSGATSASAKQLAAASITKEAHNLYPSSKSGNTAIFTCSYCGYSKTMSLSQIQSYIKDIANQPIASATVKAQGIIDQLLKLGFSADQLIIETSGGCFEKGTKILMIDGSEKNIENIEIGDMVITYNEDTKEFEPGEVVDTFIKHNTIEMLDIYFENNIHLGITACHPILTDEGWKSLNQEVALFEHKIITEPLSINQIAIGYMSLNKILKIDWRADQPNLDTYNITVENNHTYIANNIVVHNAVTKTAFASGGYTGEWGNEGRWAMLHEKELVLNKQDTENMLQAVDLVRKISSVIDLQTINSKYNQLTNLAMPQFQFSNPASQNGAFEQTVNIQAEFPGVSTSAEIEQAFDSLFLQASQYSNRNY